MKNLLRASIVTSAFLFAATANAATIEEVIPMDNSQVQFVVSSDVELPEEAVKADVKILKDLLATYAYKDPGETNKVIINLTYDMHKNTTYNLLGIMGSDANADFTVGEEIPAEIAVEGSDEIEKIKVIDSKTLEVYYKEEVEDDEFMFKVLRDLEVEPELTSENGMVNVKLLTPLEEFASYMLLVNSLSDASGSDVVFEDEFYEFDTPDYLETVLEPADLEAANDPSYMMTEEEEEEEGNIEEVAANAKRTPDTGASTWILMLLTLGASSLFFINRKK